MDVPRFYRLKRLLFKSFPLPRAGAPPTARWLALRRRIFTLAFDESRDYFSQYGQDKFVDQVVFGEQRHGVFLDVGAFDGVRINNTYFLEKSRGWTGLCIEPQPEEFARLRRARTAVCVNGCAGLEDGTVDFLQLDGGNEMLSGRVESFEAAQLARIRDATRQDPREHRVLRVPSFALPGLLRAHGLSRVDFISLDTEGGELDLLRTLDLDALCVRAITIENNHASPEIERYMTQAGFELAAFMGCDEIYRRSPASAAAAR